MLVVVVLLVVLLAELGAAAAAGGVLRDGTKEGGKNGLENVLHVVPAAPNKDSSSYHPYRRFIPYPRRTRKQAVLPSYKESFPPPYTGECVPQHPRWKSCNAPACQRQALPRFPALDSMFNQSHDYMQGVLRGAWGENPPMIDFYLRAGCGAADNLVQLFHTLALFYPAFLGDVIIVLDVNDHKAVDFIVPKELLKRYSVHIVFEEQPCFPGRVFNQYSYLNAYRYSQAEFLVTIDSDCALHRPVTPDALFNSKGELIVPTSTIFQSNWWQKEQQYFTKVNYKEFGHSMITQPVSFRVDTFAEYFAFVERQSVLSVEFPTEAPAAMSEEEEAAKTLAPKAAVSAAPSSAPTPPPGVPMCYEHVLTEFVQHTPPGVYIGLYCWMCQLSTFVKHTNRPGYDVRVTDKTSPSSPPGSVPFVRLSSHVSYEHYNDPNGGGSYHNSLKRSTLEGMCFWMDDQGAKFSECARLIKTEPDEKKRYAYLHGVLFEYVGSDLSWQFPAEAKTQALNSAKSRLKHFK